MGHQSISTILGLTNTPQVKSTNEYHYLSQLATLGIPPASVNSLAKWLKINQKQIAELIHMSTRSIQRYEKAEKLDLDTADHILQLAQVVAKGMEVFEDQEALLKWLNSDIRALGYSKPLNLLKTSFGIKMVINELIRLEYGVIS